MSIIAKTLESITPETLLLGEIVMSITIDHHIIMEVMAIIATTPIVTILINPIITDQVGILGDFL
jgi:hypothetical protein